VQLHLVVEEGFTMDWWVWVIIAIITLIVIGMFSGGDKNRKCAWCDGTKLKFKNGKEGSWYWEYRNKDGSKDKRVKDNFQKAGYNSEYKCGKCSATTKFTHLVDKKPSADVKVWKRTLVTKGNNDRKGTDWKSGSATTVNTKQANRKNN
jgi:hypothetical protein